MKSIILNLAAILTLSGFLTHIALAQERVTLINNVTIVSANENSVSRFLGNVAIEGERIIYVGANAPETFGYVEEIDGKGKFLIPGLIDSHVHLSNTAGFNGRLKGSYPEALDAYFNQLPRSYLYFGFTTLVDLNNYNPERVDKISRSPLHPDIYTCANQVKVMNDFEMEMEETPQEERYKLHFLHDRYNKDLSYPSAVDFSLHTPKSVVAEIKENGGVGVKVVYEDEATGLAVTWAKPSFQILTDLVMEAKEANIPVVIHAPSLEGHKIGLEAGVEVFAHGLWNWSSNFDKLRNRELTPEHKSVLSEISRKRIGYQLTIRTIAGEYDLITGGFMSDPNLRHAYPPEYLKILQDDENQWGAGKIRSRAAYLERTNPPFYEAILGDHSNPDDLWPKLYKLYLHKLYTVAQYLNDQGATIILGSDTPAMNMATNPPGYNGILEMRHWAAADIPLEDIFRAATLDNARAFHLEHFYGSIEVGKIANLLLLDADPLENISAYDNIERVIIRGTPVQRQALSAIEQ